jgi:hypothetical protein
MSNVPTVPTTTRQHSLVRAVHPLAGGLALVTIVTFLGATLTAEFFGSSDAVVMVKTLIPWGLLLLIPSIALAGGTGFALDRGTGRAAANARRMRIIAANGLLVLVPAAFFLAMKARAGEFDLLFYAVQGVEILAGAVNLGLVIRNVRDGLALSGRRNRKRLS